MTEIETLKRAKMYIDSLAKGINPIDGKPVSDEDVINNVRISRCLFYVAETLGKVIENGGTERPKRIKKTEFYLKEGELDNFEYSPTPISASEISKRISAATGRQEEMKAIGAKNITSYLAEIGILYDIETKDGKTVKRPTEEGVALGLSVVEVNGQYGFYKIVLYDLTAQSFIVDNINAVIEYSYLKKEEKKKKALDSHVTL